MSYEDLESQVRTSSSRSKYFEMLTSDEKQDVLNFVKYLETSSNFSKNSINSYKSYVVRSIVKSKSDEKLTSDEKSGSRKFLEFLRS